MMRNNIKKIREDKGLKQADLAEKIGTYPQQMSRIEANQESIDFKWVSKIAEALDVPEIDLLFDAGDIEEVKSANILDYAAEMDSEQYFTVPLYDISAAAGAGYHISKDSTEIIKPLIFEKAYLRQLGNPKDIYGLFIYGDSMMPVLPDGSLILVDPNKKDFWQGKIYLIRRGTMLYVKYVEADSNKIVLISANKPKYDDIIIDLRADQPEDFEILGQVVWYSCEG